MSSPLIPCLILKIFTSRAGTATMTSQQHKLGRLRGIHQANCKALMHSGMFWFGSRLPRGTASLTVKESYACLHFQLRMTWAAKTQTALLLPRQTSPTHSPPEQGGCGAKRHVLRQALGFRHHVTHSEADSKSRSTMAPERVPTPAGGHWGGSCVGSGGCYKARGHRLLVVKVRVWMHVYVRRVYTRDTFTGGGACGHRASSRGSAVLARCAPHPHHGDASGLRRPPWPPAGHCQALGHPGIRTGGC